MVQRSLFPNLTLFIFGPYIVLYKLPITFPETKYVMKNTRCPYSKNYIPETQF